MNMLMEQTKDERLRFAKVLDELKADGITQQEFASAVGITPGLVSNIKAGRNSLTLSVAKDIERAFPEYRAEWLLGLVEDKETDQMDATCVLNKNEENMTQEQRVERDRFAKMMDELKSDGITQSDLARAAGVTGPSVSRLKNGLTSLSIQTAKKIEMAFPKYRAAWLLGLDERPLSKVDALKVLDPMVSALSPERREALLEHVQDFIKLELRKEMGQ